MTEKDMEDPTPEREENAAADGALTGENSAEVGEDEDVEAWPEPLAADVDDIPDVLPGADGGPRTPPSDVAAPIPPG